ncbi:MAG: vanadium-dependent haloperoxidase [Caldimonas sp.]
MDTIRRRVGNAGIDGLRKESGAGLRRIPVFTSIVVLSIASAVSLLGACGGSDDAPVEPVTITPAGPNAVSYWNEVATATINVPGTATGTAEEQRPNYGVDLATVHVAIYDAVMAIVGTHRPYAITPSSAVATASQEAAVAAAAYRVLLGLFPARTAQYQSAYDSYLATLADGPPKTQGLAIGAEVAAGILALRANDGRSVVLSAYVPGTGPGQFRGTNPANRFFAYIKPFALDYNAQFRAAIPPALDGAVYAADLNETEALGSATSTTRTADQTALARFGTEPPPVYWPANMRVFATTSRSLAEQARLMALVWVAQADASNACFESKYFYQRWRPISAITLADSDGNAATMADPTWTPIVPAPNHPEYPAAHSCVSGAMAEIINGYYGTAAVTFDMVGSVSGVTRHYTDTATMMQEIQMARIAGGMHFRTSTVEGEKLGRNVARWILGHQFLVR